MITRIELNNFMSHKHTVIEPAPGLTVLVGPNNCGKSAVVTALQILCHNADSTYVMQHGEKECSVRVDTDDGHSIEWRRKSSPSYRINGEPFDRLGRNGIPDCLHSALRLPPIQVGEDQTVDVHFGEQKSPIFLLDKPASHRAKFFASSSDVDRFLRMQDLHRRKVEAARRDRQQLDLESQQLHAELAVLSPLDNLDKVLEQAELIFADLEDLEERIAKTGYDLADLNAQKSLVTIAAARANALNSLSALPVLAATAPLTALIDSLDRSEHDVAYMAAQCEAIRALQAPPPVRDLAPLAKSLRDLNMLERSVDRRTNELRSLSCLHAPPVMQDSESLRKLVDDLTDCGCTVDRCARQDYSLRPLSAPPLLQDAESLKFTITNVLTARRQINTLTGLKTSLEDLKWMPALSDENTLVAAIDALETAKRSTLHWREFVELGAKLGPVPEPLDVAPIAESIKLLNDSARNMTALKRTTDAAVQDFDAVKAELCTWIEANGVCPTCGGPIDPERLVEHLIAHGGHGNG